MDVLVTGAYGRVGTAIIDYLDTPEYDYDFTYFDVQDHPDHDTYVGDMTKYDQVRDAMAGQDAVIHLGFIRSPLVSATNREIQWSHPLHGNLQANTNVIEAAIEEGVEKCLYASSNHAVGLYEVMNAPDVYYPDFDLTVDHTAPIRPDSMYGLVKVFGEGLGRLASEVHDLRFYGLRIAAVREEEYDHPYGDAEKGADQGDFERGSDEYQLQVERMKAMWQSRRDFAQLVDLCLQDEDVDYDVFYGVSGQDRTWFDIEHAREVLGYEPQDDAEEWDAPPE